MYSMDSSHFNGFSLARNFYIRRAFRIYPLSILAVMTAVALHLDSEVNGVPGLSHAEPIAMGRIFSNLLLVQNLMRPGSIINVLWSLPYEVQMYIFLPFLFIWVRGRRFVSWHLCTLWLVSLLLAIGRTQLAAHGAPVGLVARLSLLEYVPNFLPGVVAFTLVQVPQVKSYLWPPFVLLLIGAYVLSPRAATGWVLCLLLGVAIPFFGEIRTAWLRAISKRIATYSYGIYLSHQFCIWFVHDPLSAFPLWSKIMVLAAMLIAIPILLYHGIERPMINVGTTLAQKWGPQSKRVAARALW